MSGCLLRVNLRNLRLKSETQIPQIDAEEIRKQITY